MNLGGHRKLEPTPSGDRPNPNSQHRGLNNQNSSTEDD